MGTRRLGRPVTKSTAGGGSPTRDRDALGAPWVDPADRRVGILGGTFDPIHYGHLVIAEQVREALELDRVLFIPAAMPPHKLGLAITAASDRAAMVELAIAGNPSFAICRIELDRSGPSYTVDTLETFANEGRRQGIVRKLFFILSSEAARALPSWRAPARILELAQLAVVPRPGFPVLDGQVLGAMAGGSEDRVLTIETLPLAHSASDIRRRASAGRSIRYLVPPAVEAYIRDHRLYRSEDPRRTA
jgi:nicotinate-nucleotide adenylyltransferase